MLVYERDDECFVNKQYEGKLTGGLCFSQAGYDTSLRLTNVNEAIAFVYSQFLSLGFVVVSNEENPNILYVEGRPTLGGHLYVSDELVLMVYVPNMDSIMVHMKARMVCSFRDVSPVRVALSNFSRITGQLPSKYSFIGDDLLCEYNDELCLKASYAHYKAGRLCEAYGLKGGSSGFDFLPDTVVGACASVLSQQRGNKRIRDLDDDEGITYLSDLSRDVSSLKSGDAVGFDHCYVCERPNSEAYSRQFVPFYLKQSTDRDILTQVTMIVAVDYDLFACTDALINSYYEKLQGEELTSPMYLMSQWYQLADEDTFRILRQRLNAVKSKVEESEIERILLALRSLNSTVQQANFHSVHQFTYGAEVINVTVPVLVSHLTVPENSDLEGAYQLVRDAIHKFGIFVTDDLRPNEDLDVQELHQVIEAPVQRILNEIRRPYSYVVWDDSLDFTKSFGCGEEHSYHAFREGVDDGIEYSDFNAALDDASFARSGGYDHHAPRDVRLVDYDFVSTGRRVRANLLVCVRPSDLIGYPYRSHLRETWGGMLKRALMHATSELELRDGDVSVEFLKSSTPTSVDGVTFALQGNKADFGGGVWAIHDPRSGGVRLGAQKVGRFFEGLVSDKTLDVAAMQSQPEFFYRILINLPLATDYSYSGERADRVLNALAHDLAMSTALAWLAEICDMIPDGQLIECGLDSSTCVPMHIARIVGECATTEEVFDSLRNADLNELSLLDQSVIQAHPDLLEKVTNVKRLLKKEEGLGQSPIWYSSKVPKLKVDKSLLSLYPEVL